VLIIESLAQTGALAVLSAPDNVGKIALFAGIEKARFKQQVLPGDTLELTLTLTRQRGPIGEGEGTATVDGVVVCQATLRFAVIERDSE
jgi:3-hydroxyacyl-[acyl-carrier-protein] dehydratase